MYHGMQKVNLSIVFLAILILSCCTERQFKQKIVSKYPALTLPAKIDSIVAFKMNQYNIPGLSIAVVVSDSVVYTQGYGVSDIASLKPVTEHSFFHTGSVSKVFTALAIMHLVKEGKLNIEDKLTSVTPKLKFQDPRASSITIKTVLNHTSGIPDVTGYNWSNNHQAANSLEMYLLDNNLTLEFEPSTKYLYSNLGYDILGYVVQQVSGKTFEDYVKSNILLPSGMRGSDFRYFLIADTLKTSPHSKQWITGAVYTRSIYPYTREHAPSSTLNSSASELSTWMIHFMRGLQMQSDSSLWRTMIKPSTKLNDYIGLGFQLYSIGNKKAIGHFGGDKGYRSYLLLLPDEKIGLVVMANCDYNEDFRQEILHPILRIMLQEE